MTKPIIVVKVPCKLLYIIQVKEFLIKCSASWPYLISEFLVAYITIVASDWPCTFFTPKVFLFSIMFTTTYRIVQFFDGVMGLMQHCNRVTSIDPDDLLTHWPRPGDPENDLDVIRIKFFELEIYISQYRV